MSQNPVQSQISSILVAKKHEKGEREDRVKEEREKLMEMIDVFYEKTKVKIDKNLSKDSKKSTLLCKELLGQLSHYPKQQVYEISRLSDEVFNQISKLNTSICEFLKTLETLRQKIGRQLQIQKQRVIVKQEKQGIGEYHLAALRKISFKKEKTCLSHRLRDMDTLNKKLVKFEASIDEEQSGCTIEIDGKRIQCFVQRYKKIQFESKRREYLLCLNGRKEGQQGQLFLYNDKLQTITTFSHLLPINFSNLIDIVQIENFLFIVHPHQIVRINLTNQVELLCKVFREKIVRTDTLQGGLVLWIQDAHFNLSVLFLTSELEIFNQNYLRLNIKSINFHFKLGRKELYFIAGASNGTTDLLRIKGVQIDVVLKDIGIIDEVVEYRVERLQSMLFRKGGKLFRFLPSRVIEKLIQVDLDNGQSMQKCCILGEHFYALHQSGKYLLECHFQLPQEEQNPEP